ncbi:MAG: hypothetical protein KAJ51_16620 [Thermoplasmata archaeon]|nr:hypothetical protein [Thermoplasmata archaeon]
MVDTNEASETKKQSAKSPVLDAEDKIISIFCQNNGGMEFAMPIVRKQFADAGVDFKNPNKDELIRIVKKLIEITKEFQGAEVAKENFREYMHIINKLENE